MMTDRHLSFSPPSLDSAWDSLVCLSVKPAEQKQVWELSYQENHSCFQQK